MSLIWMDDKDIRKLERDLGKFVLYAVPHATRNALNSGAFEARKIWGAEVASAFTLRNKYTQRSQRVVKATGSNIETMEATVGSVAHYMDEQELGTDETKKGKHGVAIPTNSAAGGTLKAVPRKKRIQRKNWMSALKVPPTKVTGSRQRRNAVAIVMAQKSTGIAYLDLRKRRGLFRITGTKRGIKVRMLWDLTRPRIVRKPRPTLQRTLEKLEPRIGAIHTKALVDQLKRAKILGF